MEECLRIENVISNLKKFFEHGLLRGPKRPKAEAHQSRGQWLACLNGDPVCCVRLGVMVPVHGTLHFCSMTLKNTWWSQVVEKPADVF